MDKQPIAPSFTFRWREERRPKGFVPINEVRGPYPDPETIAIARRDALANLEAREADEDALQLRIRNHAPQDCGRQVYDNPDHMIVVFVRQEVPLAIQMEALRQTMAMYAIRI